MGYNVLCFFSNSPESQKNSFFSPVEPPLIITSFVQFLDSVVFHTISPYVGDSVVFFSVEPPLKITSALLLLLTQLQRCYHLPLQYGQKGAGVQEVVRTLTFFQHWSPPSKSQVCRECPPAPPTNPHTEVAGDSTIAAVQKGAGGHL